jgi:hypothetical protein
VTERVRLVGIARAFVGQTDRRVLVQRTIVADEQGAFGRIDVLDAFDIELEGGRRLRVEMSKEARIEPLSTKKKKWGELENDPSFASIRDRGPGPHVTVTVKRAAIEDGDRIALAGEEKEFFFEEAKEGLRDAPKRELSMVSADLVASGSDAEEILAHALDGPAAEASPVETPKADKRTRKEREKKPRTLRSYVTVPRVFVLVGIFLLLVAATMRRSTGFLDAIITANGSFAIATFAWAWRSLPRFVHGNKAVEDTKNAEANVFVGGMLALPLMVVFAGISDLRYAWSPPPKGVEEANASYLVGAIAFIYVTLIFVNFVRSTRRRAALLGTIVDAAPFTAMPDETKWGSIEGVVRDPTPIKVGGGPRALANVIEREVRPGSDPDIVTEKVLNEGTFFIDADVGSFELDPRSATWASDVHQVVTDTEKKKVHADVVVIGGHAVVAGRAVTPAKGQAARFIAGRADSLVFFATARDVDARAKATKILSRRRLAAVLVGAFALSIAGSMVRYEPELPALHLEGGGD